MKMTETMFEIYCGSKETMVRCAERGVKGLNRKTHKWQVVDKAAKYIVKHDGGLLYSLHSDIDLKTIAKQKGLIL